MPGRNGVMGDRPEIVAAVLPPPLSPAERPLVRLTLTIVEMPGLPAFGAGWLGVAAMHGDVPGEYPIFMPMTTEQSVIGGRETYGEPKKIAEVWARRDGDSIEAGISRMGFPLVEVRGTVNEKREPYELDKRDFWFKVLPSPERPGELDTDALLVYGEKHEQARVHEGIDGTVVLKDSRSTPSPTSRSSRWSTSTGPSARRLRSAERSARFRPLTSRRTCTSDTTTSRFSSRSRRSPCPQRPETASVR